MRVHVAGAGMAGLVAAVRLTELGHEPVVLEKGTRPGGSMLLSSCVVWRHVELERFRAECPDGDGSLQRLVWDRFDDSVAWLERTSGVVPVWQDTSNPLTTGRRYDPSELTRALVAKLSHIRVSKTGTGWAGAHRPTAGSGAGVHTPHPLVLATGGFPVRLARERGLLVRSNPWSDGDGLDHARALGAATAGDLSEFYGRAMPAPPAAVDETGFVRLAQVWGDRARVVDDAGGPVLRDRPAWHENDLAQAIARLPGAEAWVVLDAAAADEPRIRDARAAGATVVEQEGELRIRVTVGVTHTIGGIRIDESTRVMSESGAPIDGLFAAGVDVGGIASGGYASGLAQALVLGLVAAESVSAL